MNRGAPVAPLSAAKIRTIAKVCRVNFLQKLERLGKNIRKLPLDMIAEGVFGIEVEIVSKEDMPVDYARAIPERNTIYLREDTYEKLVQGDCRARFTVAHELGHIFLNHRIDQAFARSENGKGHENFRDSEWQADTFASELLAPSDVYENMTDEEISRIYGISMRAIEVTREKLQKNKRRNQNRNQGVLSFVS